MKQILRAIDQKLRAQEKEIAGLRNANQNLHKILDGYRDDMDGMVEKIKSVEASRYRIWEKVCHANKEWQDLPVQMTGHGEYKWLDHLKYIAEHAPEGQ